MSDTKFNSEYEIKGGWEDETKTLHCTNCGCISFSLIGHADGTDFFENLYRCDKCGSEISIRTKLLEPRCGA